MQKNYMVKKIKILFDGNIEYSGLSECSEIKDVSTLVDVPTFNRKIPVNDNVSKFEPLTLKYIITKGSNTPNFFWDWKNNTEYHDVLVIQTDATGTEISKWSLRDCECTSVVESAYNATTPEAYFMTVIINCTTIPQRREV